MSRRSGGASTARKRRSRRGGYARGFLAAWRRSRQAQAMNDAAAGALSRLVAVLGYRG